MHIVCNIMLTLEFYNTDQYILLHMYPNRISNYSCDDQGNLNTMQIRQSRKRDIFQQTVQRY